jgi:DNA repair protein RecO (recombination protein O)
MGNETAPLGSGGLCRAFVLHRRDYGDTSLLVEVFALGQGRFPAIARGVRRSRRGSSALLQPFQPLWLGLAGRGEVRTLTRVEAAGRPFDLVGLALPCGFYLNELLVRLLGRGDPHDPLFGLYHAALADLHRGDRLHDALRGFELRLLQELGYGPALDLTDEGSPVRADLRYRVDPGQAPVPVDGAPAGEIPGDTRGETPCQTLGGATLLALCAGTPLEGEQQREARSLLRALLAPHLGSKALQSRELMRQWHGARRNRGANPSDPSG